MEIRRPAVAGSFYPDDPEELSKLIDDCYLHPLGPGRRPPARPGVARTVAAVCPHAGYVYSGPVAAHSYLHLSTLPDPELIVVVAPDHYGTVSGVSTFKSGEWETPLGRLRVDTDASKELADEAGIVTFDPESQRLEHSLEVQLPFLQAIYGARVPLLPVSMMFQDSDTAGTLGAAIGKVLAGRRAILIASSDLTHYEPAADARRKDTELLKDIERMDVDGFYHTLDRLHVTACGYGAIATVMTAASGLGLKRAEVLKYATSGDTSGDNARVVGYGAVRFV